MHTVFFYLFNHAIIKNKVNVLFVYVYRVIIKKYLNEIIFLIIQLQYAHPDKNTKKKKKNNKVQSFFNFIIRK